METADGDLASILRGSASDLFIVLAPTNDAFARFLSTNGFASLAEVPADVLSQILLNHVISADLKAADLVGLGSGYTKTNALGAGGNTMSLYFDTNDGVKFNNMSSVSTADINASNGTIHIVDAVIDLPSIVDHAENNPNFSSLAEALVLENLTTTLQTDGPFTVLAPTNDAFATFLDPDSNSNPTGNVLSNILLNHVISGTRTSEDLLEQDDTFTTTLATGPNDTSINLYANTSEVVRFKGVSSITLADIIGTNGIIHAVDAVINIPTVVTFALAIPNFLSLSRALEEADSSDTDPMLISTLSGPGPFTLFAPLNSSFTNLINSNPAWNSIEDVDDNLLNTVLLHHVVSGNIRIADIEDGDTPATLEGDIITINRPGTNVNIADVTDGAENSDIGIIGTNVQTGNGVIQVLNKGMLPTVE